MKQILRKTAATAALTIALTFGAGVSAHAHVTVKPATAPAASFETFTVSVPNEKDIPTTEVRLVIPGELNYVTPTQKANWDITTKKNGETVTEITWEGSVGAGFRDELSFSAQVPSKTGTITWKAYQTYADGTVVAWDETKQSDGHGGDENKGPASITEVTETDATKETSSTSEESTNTWPTVIAGTALVVSLLSFIVSVRRTSK